MRLAIITDIHEDINSLKEAITKIKKLGCHEIICLGDISGYSIPHYDYLKRRNAHDCLSLIRAECSIVLLGNHDLHAAKKIPDNCAFFEFPENWYQMNYHDRHKLGNNILWLHEENDLDPLYKAEDLEYLRSLPEIAVFNDSGKNILFSHYIYPNISGLKKEFYTYRDEFKQHFQFMAEKKCDVSFTGHSHVRGFFIATPDKYRTFNNSRITLSSTPVCVGIPPITSNNKRNGFCIFNTDEMSIRAIRI